MKIEKEGNKGKETIENKNGSYLVKQTQEYIYTS